jgi:extracellular factor (EF) 3-hydroxypalmitic acid methyl ester biosynthesis protein
VRLARALRHRSRVNDRDAILPQKSIKGVIVIRRVRIKGQNKMIEKVNGHRHAAMPAMHARDPAARENDTEVTRAWREAVAMFNGVLERLDTRCGASDADVDALSRELETQIHRVEDACREIEQSLGNDPEALARKQREFRRETDRFFARSYLMHRARNWPRGYPGDYEIIERTYESQALSDGIGGLLDRYFQQTTLARAIRYRRERMREILAEEMRSRRAPRVLNIGCGSCREVVELAPVIQQTGARFTCVDLDAEALVFSAGRAREAGIQGHVTFRQYNALRMVKADRNIREFGRFDIIYTIGLLDYLNDDVLICMLQSLYQTLHPQGVLVAVFKDADRYDTADYHWLVDWSAFRQRTGQDSWRLLDRAGIPADRVVVQRSQDDVMIFYRVLRTRDTGGHNVPPEPHHRRTERIDPPPRHPTERPASVHKPITPGQQI